MVELGEAGRACVAVSAASHLACFFVPRRQRLTGRFCERTEAVKSVVSDKDQLNPNAF